MCQILVNFLIIICAMYLHSGYGYKTFSLLNMGSCSNGSAIINMDSMSWNSSGILVASHNGVYRPDLHCEVTLRPPLSYGMVVSIRFLDLQPLSINQQDCQNYLEISPTEDKKSVRLCGYSDDSFEFKAYSSWSDMKLILHTANTSHYKKASFQLTFTAVRKGHGWCFAEETHCFNKKCIWKGLACDGHNNCGDLSDELDKNVSQCSAMSPGESLAVILVTIVGSLILLFIAAYLRGPKITRQIERLSQCRRNSCTEARNLETETAANDEDRTPTPFSVNRLRTPFDSTSGLLRHPEDDVYSDVALDDPPPRYEDVQSLTIVPISYGVSIERIPHPESSVS